MQHTFNGVTYTIGKEISMDIITIDKLHGMLLGLAVGDALGTTNEFKKNPTPITDMVGGGPFNLEVGQWTDDTSLAICLADSLIECGGFNPHDQMLRYVEWYKKGHNSVNGTCFDIGGTTANALDKFIVTGNPYSGNNMNTSAGNGSLMRLAPIVIFYHSSVELVIKYAELSSATTHPAPAAVDACKYFAQLLINIIYNPHLTKIELFNHDFMHDDFCKPIENVSLYDYYKFNKHDLEPTGYVVDSLICALYCFYNTDNFKDGCLMAANLGGDADTIAAIYGQLAGTFYGKSGIPQEWLNKLAWYDQIDERVRHLYTVGNQNLTYVRGVY